MFFEKWLGKKGTQKPENKDLFLPLSGEVGQGAGRRDEGIFRGESVGQSEVVSPDRKPADVTYEYAGSDGTSEQVESVGGEPERGSAENTTGEQRVILERIRKIQEDHPESFRTPGSAAEREGTKAA